jgi:segregation and condensation protein B
METLAIIAYRQPLVRSEIEQVRGVDTAGVLKTLLERRLVRIVGRKDVPGRPIMYGTTKQFLQAFGLKDLADLPALRDIKDLQEAEPFMLPNVDAADELSSERLPEAMVRD